MTVGTRPEDSIDNQQWHAHVVRLATDTGSRLAGLMATDTGHGTRLTAITADSDDQLLLTHTQLPVGQQQIVSLTPKIPAASWYEREIHDRFGIVPTGHPRLDPLILPARDGSGSRSPSAHVSGEGVFLYPHGPVRSAATEAIEYDIETPGEDIPYPQIRVYYKHRGLEQRFEGLDLRDGAVLAERVEGIAGVAHAIGYASAVESAAGTTISDAARRVRVFYAELERVANHLDVVIRLCEAAALAVATTRFGWHKERVLRLISGCCGSRFGRGVIVPGGVRSVPGIAPQRLRAEIADLIKDIGSDATDLMATPSFLDRLRGTGVLSPELARQHGALGPIGRASAAVHDARTTSELYADLARFTPPRLDIGDAQSRLQIRWSEIEESSRLLLTAVDDLDRAGEEAPLITQVDPDLTGRGIGRVEAPQGELLYLVEIVDGHLVRCKPRTASFHNLPLFHAVFNTDILTDFPFIEASFGLSPAGVAM